MSSLILLIDTEKILLAGRRTRHSFRKPAQTISVTAPKKWLWHNSFLEKMPFYQLCYFHMPQTIVFPRKALIIIFKSRCKLIKMKACTINHSTTWEELSHPAFSALSGKSYQKHNWWIICCFQNVLSPSSMFYMKALVPKVPIFHPMQ